MKRKDVKKIVRERYGRVAKEESSCCSSAACCAGGDVKGQLSASIGYSEDELKSLPKGANLGLGCGNPTAFASLKKGEIVMDLGSGAGIDCFLAAKKVGPSGRVIGVDMTAEMLEKAKENARKGGYKNVEFRLGEIENLPAADGSVDVIISNCVINLSPDKKQVFKEAFRVLKPGGRIMVSDLVILKSLPEPVKKSVEMYVGCVAGALLKKDYLDAIRKAGFEKIDVMDESLYPMEFIISERDTLKQLRIPEKDLTALAQSVASVKVRGYKLK